MYTLQIKQVQFEDGFILNLFILDIGSALRDKVESLVTSIADNTTLFVPSKKTLDVNVQPADLLCSPGLRAYDMANKDIGKIKTFSFSDPGNGAPLSKTALARALWDSRLMSDLGIVDVTD